MNQTGIPVRGASRIIPAEQLQAQRGVASFAIDELQADGAPQPPHQLSRRDLDNETARAAYTLGRRRGFEQGAREGQQQGFTEGSTQLTAQHARRAADAAQQMQALADAFRLQLKELEAAMARDLVTLALGIARQVVRHELQSDMSAVLPVAREALKAVGDGAAHMELRAHPDDVALLRSQFDNTPGAAQWQFVEDDAMARGGVIVAADTGFADASIEARWGAVLASLGQTGESLDALDSPEPAHAGHVREVRESEQ